MRRRAHTCNDCLMPRAFCVCRVMEKETVCTRITVVVHYSDVTRKSNTGRLIPLVMTNSEVLVRGTKGEPLDITRAVQPEHHNLVLFPSAESRPLNADYLKSIEQPINLIVPDGNWNQAGKMEKREKLLACIPRVHLEISKPSSYRLRTAAHENWISTFEAVARSLGLVENCDLQKKMEYFFDVFVERLLYLKGRIPGQDVTGGITPEMIHQFHTENNDHSFIKSKNNTEN
jgi:DTW domain-containing protein